MPTRTPRPRTSELLAQIAANSKDDKITLGYLVDSIEQRAFGFLLIFVTLPCFIPAPIGVGAIFGPLAAFLGVQMLVGLEHPWLPQWLRRRGLSRETMTRFLTRLGRWLAKLERVVRPRWLGLTDQWGERFSGLVIMGLGIALALPIPFTNYPFGGALLLMSIALTERDGVLLAICWAAGLAIVGTVIGFSGAIFDTVRDWLT